MNIYSIYKATNTLNSKIYIGFTSDFNKRVKKHKAKYKNEKDLCYNTKFYRALRKYGFRFFTWEIIYQSKDYEYTINKMENFFIEEYNSFTSGYNMTLGGEGCYGKNTKEFIFIAPDKKIIKTSHLKKFCADNNLNYQCMLDVHNKRQKSHRGYKNITCVNYVCLLEKRFDLLSPDGDHIIVNNLKQFCKENGLCDSHMYSLFTGSRKSHKGWTVYK